MPLYVYKRPGSDVWYIRGKVQHLSWDRSARTTSRGEADALKAKIEADLFKRAVYGDRAVATFDEAVTHYLDADGSPDHLEPIMDRIGHRLLKDIDQNLIDKLAREMKPAASAATRVRQVYTPILAVMTAAARAKLCEPLLLKKPKVAGGRTEYLTPQQAEDWLAALPPHLHRLVTFYLGTGCRASEALYVPPDAPGDKPSGLIWKDITLGERRAVFWETKEDYARGVDLQARVRAILPARGEAPDDPVFLNSRGHPWHGYDAINLMLKRIRARRLKAIAEGADLPTLPLAHCHLFRHTWATWAYACTRDLTLLMSQGGWKTVSMVMRYTHVATADLAEAVWDAGWEPGGRPDPRPKKRIKKSYG
jgi:integrase